MPGRTCIRSARAIWDSRNTERIDRTFIAPADYCQRECSVEIERRRIYSKIIEFFRNGSEWWRLRSEFQKGLSSPHHIRKFLSDSDSITKEFVAHIQATNVGANQVPDILPELSRLNLERMSNRYSFKLAIQSTFFQLFAIWHLTFGWRASRRRSASRIRSPTDSFKRPKTRTVACCLWTRDCRFGVTLKRQCIGNFERPKSISKGISPNSDPHNRYLHPLKCVHIFH